MAWMIFSGDDYYPAGGWADHDRTCETLSEAMLAIQKIRGDWLHIVGVATGERINFLWANKQWMERSEAQAWLAGQDAKARAEFDRTHVALPAGAPYCGGCKIGTSASWCSCGKYGAPSVA